MSGAPLISVVIPVYDVFDYLPACLDSVLGPMGSTPESGPSVEVITVDDASPDGCGPLLDARASAETALPMVSVTAIELAPKLDVPAYRAVIRWLPTVRALVVSVAWPVALSVFVPRTVAPSRKVIDPVGMLAPGTGVLTAAENVTGWPFTAVLGEALSEVRVASTILVAEVRDTRGPPSMETTIPLLWTPAFCGVTE